MDTIEINGYAGVIHKAIRVYAENQETNEPREFIIFTEDIEFAKQQAIKMVETVKMLDNVHLKIKSIEFVEVHKE